ncbi:hypothetical protein ACFVGX_15920 [Streptomyces sp. NPDC127113]|uniref:hypothetical protein n=1 Tax=Streptomyces sp. NPDC127113 TaxID=3345365 RepID=UPI00363206C6
MEVEALRGCEVVDGHRATGVRRVSRDAGAAVGGQSVIIGSAPALSILTAVAVAAVATGHTATDIAARSGAALTGSAVLLALALALALTTVLTLIVPARAARNERTL